MTHRIDLHVHSRYSNDPSDWYLRRLKAAESYTEPEFIYQTALQRGMSLATITDHDGIEGALLLNARHPERTFTGVESAVYFPGEDCKVHVLVYGLTAEDFREIERARQDIYQFRECIKERRLAYSVAHALLAVGKHLTTDHLEKLVLLFDVFETINGSQTRAQNEAWLLYLKSLTPALIDDLYARHRIEPISPDPWVKGLTGGSDDHAGLFIGETFTQTAGEGSVPPDPAAFLEALRQKHTLAGGNHSTYRDMVLTVFKIGYEVAAHMPNRRGALRLAGYPLVRQIAESVFANRPINGATRIQVRVLNKLNGLRPTPTRSLVLKLADRLAQAANDNCDEKARLLHDVLADTSDEYLKTFIRSASSGIETGNLAPLARSIQSPLIGLLLSAPFYTTLGIMNRSRHLVNHYQARYGKVVDPHERRILWFTDENGPGALPPADMVGRLVLVSASANPGAAAGRAVEQIRLPLISEVAFTGLGAGGAARALRIPSPLRSLERVFEFEPDEIYIATPGPVGALGLLFSYLLNVRSVGVSREDFLAHLAGKPEQEGLPGWLSFYSRWFYSKMDEVLQTADISLPAAL